MLYGPVAGVAGYDPVAIEGASEQMVGEMVDEACARPGRTAPTVERTVVCGGAAPSLLDAAEGPTWWSSGGGASAASVACCSARCPTTSPATPLPRGRGAPREPKP